VFDGEFLKSLATYVLPVLLGLALSGSVVAHADTNSAQRRSQKTANKTWEKYVKQQKKQQKKELKSERKAQKNWNKHHRNGRA
jgi:hypothetical protein